MNLHRLIIPSDAALNLHKMRGEFIVKLALESSLASSNHYKRPDEYGRKRLGDTGNHGMKILKLPSN